MAHKVQGALKRPQRRNRYDAGPLGFLSDQIRKSMAMAGYPAVEKGIYGDFSNTTYVLATRPWEEAHAYSGAVDLTRQDATQFTQDEKEPFWDCMWDCVYSVGEKFGVEFVAPRWSDPGHVELANWHDFKELLEPSQPTHELRRPSQLALDWYFMVTLPSVWKQHIHGAKRSPETPIYRR